MVKGLVYNTKLEQRIDRYMATHGEAMDPRTVIHNMWTRGLWPKTEQTPKRLSFYFRISKKYVKLGPHRPYTYVWKQSYNPARHGV